MEPEQLAQVLDSPNDRGREYEACTIGDGAVDIPECLRIIKAAGFDDFAWDRVVELHVAGGVEHEIARAAALMVRLPGECSTICSTIRD